MYALFDVCIIYGSDATAALADMVWYLTMFGLAALAAVARSTLSHGRCGWHCLYIDLVGAGTYQSIPEATRACWLLRGVENKGLFAPFAVTRSHRTFSHCDCSCLAEQESYALPPTAIRCFQGRWSAARPLNRVAG